VIGWGSASLDELSDLLQDIQTIPEVAALAVDKQRELALLLLNALGHYRAGEDLKGTRPYPHVDIDHEGNILGYRLPPVSRGPIPQPHKDHFINDCVDAWRRVTGETVQVWYSDARDEPSVTMKIADAALSGTDGWAGVSGLKKRARRARDARNKAGQQG
jgi:hypothetical protein